MTRDPSDNPAADLALAMQVCDDIILRALSNADIEPGIGIVALAMALGKAIGGMIEKGSPDISLNAIAILNGTRDAFIIRGARK